MAIVEIQQTVLDAKPETAVISGRKIIPSPESEGQMWYETDYVDTTNNISMRFVGDSEEDVNNKLLEYINSL